MTTADDNTARPDPGSMSYEDAMRELEEIVERIEDGEIGLEQSLTERKRGEALIRRCRSIIDQAEQELEHIDRDAIEQERPDEPDTK